MRRAVHVIFWKKRTFVAPLEISSVGNEPGWLPLRGWLGAMCGGFDLLGQDQLAVACEAKPVFHALKPQDGLASALHQFRPRNPGELPPPAILLAQPGHNPFSSVCGRTIKKIASSCK